MIKRYDRNSTERSARIHPIGKLFKGAPKEGNRPGKNLDYFRFVPMGTMSDRLGEIWDHHYGETPNEIRIFFKHDDIDHLIDDWYTEFATGGLLKTRCDGETITEWRDDRGVFHLNEPKPCRAPNNPKGCDKCKAGALIKFGVSEFRYHGYSGNVEISTTSINDIIFLKAQLQEIAEELKMVNTSLKFAPLVLSRSPRVITKTTSAKQFRGEESLLYISVDPSFQMQIDRAMREAKYASIGASYEPQAIAGTERLALAPAIAVQAEIIEDDRPQWEPFFARFTDMCKEAATLEALNELIKWSLSRKTYLAYPENCHLVENAIAEVQARIDF